MRHCLHAVLFLVLAIASHLGAEEPVYDIPLAEGITIDGDAKDWKKRGFQVQVMSAEHGQTRPPTNFDAQARFAWDANGLICFISVLDDVPREHDLTRHLFNGDSIEFFVAPKIGIDDRYELVISPGWDPAFPEPRHAFFDKRLGKERPLEYLAQRRLRNNGYDIEVLLPWSNLGVAPEVGSEVAVQLYVIDSDNPSDLLTLMLHRKGNAHQDTRNMARFRLTPSASPDVDIVAGGKLEEGVGIQIDVTAIAKLAGTPVQVTGLDGSSTKGLLEMQEGRAKATFKLPLPPAGTGAEFKVVLAGGRVVSLITMSDDLPDPAKRWANALMNAEITADSLVIADSRPPKVIVKNADKLEGVIGPFRIKTTLYDANYAEVQTCADKGRYGIVVDIVPQKGIGTRRLLTVARPAKPFRSLPDSFKDHPAVAALRFPKWPFLPGVEGDLDFGKFVCGIGELGIAAKYTDRSADVWAADRQWWVGLKRKLYGWDRLYTRQIEPPKVLAGDLLGPPAPVLREGTAAEAGMKESVIAELDQLFDAIEAESRGDRTIGMAVLLARDGVVFFHRAFGYYGQQQMTVNTKLRMESQTKPISGTLLAMLVDQGFLDFDEPVGKYLPAFADAKTNLPITIRHCWTHRHGYWGHWGDTNHELEDLLAPFAPTLEVGRYQYSGTGMALGGKAMEAVTGLALPQLYRKLLLDPLAMRYTNITDAHSDAEMTPFDAAKICQLLLNRGAYGDLRFFGEATYQRLIPSKGQPGFGMVAFDGLGSGTFGHNAGHAGLFRIDPTNRFVVTVTTEYKNRSFHKKLFTILLGGIDNGKK